MSLTFKIKIILLYSLLLSSTTGNTSIFQAPVIITDPAQAKATDSVGILKEQYKAVKIEKNENIDRLIAAKKKADADVLKLKKERKVLTNAWVESQREIIALKMELAARSDKPEVELEIPDSFANMIDTFRLPEVKKEIKPKKSFINRFFHHKK